MSGVGWGEEDREEHHGGGGGELHQADVRVLATLLNPCSPPSPPPDLSPQLSSILMRIIRTLSESDSGHQREEQKRRLQLQWKESDGNVDQLVFRKQKDLSRVMQVR